MSSSDNKLQRAHQLSAQGSSLSGPVDADAATLRRALESYTEAADLFEAAGASADDGTRHTLRMLVLQHRKYVRDLERRIASLASAPTSPTFPNSSSSSLSQARSSSPFLSSPPLRTGNGTPTPGARRASSAAVGLSAASNASAYSRPGLVHATSPPRSIPPFTLRPVEATAPPSLTGPFGNPGSSPRELYSSSSSSEPPDESFLLPGSVPDTHDPYSTFWANLENMLDEISIPRAVTMAPLEVLSGSPRKPHLPLTKSKGKGKSRVERSPSPSESFYVVPRGRQRDPDDEPARNSTPTAKTNEELTLENESLRASLDALAKHAHQLEIANRALAERAEERDKIVRSVVSGVRREAQKARHDQEVMRSQLLASTATLPPGQQSGPPVAGKSSLTSLLDQPASLRKRVGELEEEVRWLKDDNGKLRAQLDKFKERWDKLKAKKEAKVAAAKLARTSKSPDPPLE